MTTSPTSSAMDERTDAFERVVDNLDANFGVAPHKRAAHAKGLVLDGHFTASAEASSISRARHLSGRRVEVIARVSSFPGGGPHPDAAPECNPRGLAVQFRLDDGSTTDLLAHSIDGFPGRTAEDFADFLGAIAPGGPGPSGYLADHGAAAAFVGSIQSHGVPASFATLSYYPVNAFRFHDAADDITVGRYTWVPVAGHHYLSAEQAAASSPDYLASELATRLHDGPVSFVLLLQIAEDGDVTDDANAHWPSERRVAELGTLHLTSLSEDSDTAEQGLFFDPVRLVDGISLSDDPLLIGRTRTYPISLARRHNS
jgi:catalase